MSEVQTTRTNDHAIGPSTSFDDNNSMEDGIISDPEIINLATSTLHQLNVDGIGGDDDGKEYSKSRNSNGNSDSRSPALSGAQLWNHMIHEHVKNSNHMNTMEDHGNSTSPYVCDHMKDRIDVEDEYLSKLTIDTLRTFREDDSFDFLQRPSDEDDEMDLEERNLMSAEALVREELMGLETSHIMPDHLFAGESSSKLGVKKDIRNELGEGVEWHGEELANEAVRVGLDRLEVDMKEYTCALAFVPGCQYPDVIESRTFNREYLRSMSGNDLQKIFVGLVPYQIEESSSEQSRISSTDNQIDNDRIKSIRTVSLQIRPDVLCGAVMDAISTAVLLECHGDIKKRQGSHLIATLPAHRRLRSSGRNEVSSDVISSPANFFRRKVNEQDTDNEYVLLPALDVDAQICTRRNGGYFERYLILRFFMSNAFNDVVVDDVLMENSDHAWAKSDNIWKVAKTLKSIQSEWIVNETSEQLATPVKNFARALGQLWSPMMSGAHDISEDNSDSPLKNFPVLSHQDAVDAAWKCIAKVSILNNFKNYQQHHSENFIP